MTTTREAALEAALTAMLQSVCGPTGFAEAVRHNSGKAYPWHSLEAAEAQAHTALSTPATEPQGYVDGPQFRALKTCKGCAHFKSEYWREPSGDGETYDSGTSADCLKAGRSISTYHGSEPAPPDWCPLAACPAPQPAAPELRPGQYVCDRCTRVVWGGDHVCPGAPQPAADTRVVVKPLVWQPSPDPMGHDHWVASALGGSYHMAPDEDSPGVWVLQWTIRQNDFCMSYGGTITRHPSPEAAQAAAQADYTARILSALPSASPLGAVVMRERVVAEIRRWGEDNVANMVTGTPASFTDAELLAAAAELLSKHFASLSPEELGRFELAVEIDGALAALAPFTRKGE